MSVDLPTTQWERIAQVLSDLLERRPDSKVGIRLVREILALEIEHQFDEDRGVVHDKIRTLVDRHLDAAGDDLPKAG